jgi:capsular polysaccharide transport system ATP-binding protein
MIRLTSVSKVYPTRLGPRKVLDDISFDVMPGQKIGILGINGSGKSTLVRILSGAEKPSTGRVERRMSVSWPLAFSGGFQGSLTGADNLRCICRIYNADYKKALPFVVDFSELNSYIYEPFKTYSSGMAAKFAFGVSMAIDFDCFLIDEITAVGDASFQKKCKHELFEKRKDKSIILVSHNPASIRSACNSAAVLTNGKLFGFETLDSAFKFHESMGAAPIRPPMSRAIS